MDSHADAPAVCRARNGSLVRLGGGVFHVLEAVQGVKPLLIQHHTF